MVEVKYNGKKYNIQKKYLGNLKGKDLQKQIKSIVEKKDRPKINTKSNTKSKYVIQFTKKYDQAITNKSFISKNIISNTGIDKILNKGRGAYYSSGSRPNQSSSSWAYARLASVIMNGPARKVDKDIWLKYKK